MIDIELRKRIIQSDAILEHLPNAAEAGIVQQNLIEQGADNTRIWYRRADDEKELCNSGESLLTVTRFDVEVMSPDIDLLADLSQALVDTLHGYRGILADSIRVKMVKCDLQSEEYKPVNANEENGLHVSSYLIELWH